MLGYLLISLLGQTPQTTEVPTQPAAQSITAVSVPAPAPENPTTLIAQGAPGATPEPIIAQPIPAAPRTVPTGAPTGTAPRKAVKGPRATPRIDQTKPYMRVWYWPPSPTGAVSGFSPTSSISTPGNPETASVKPLGETDVDDINFPTNLAKVVDEKAQLARLAQWMKANPSVSIELDGYADPRGSKASNMKLSQKRVSAVKDYLVASGVPEGRIVTRSHGSDSPMKGQNPEETFWLSRRVTVHFVKGAASTNAPATPKALESEAKPPLVAPANAHVESPTPIEGGV